MSIYQTIYPSERFHIGREIAVLLLASLLLTLSAKISAPFYPVPMTMQTFVAVGVAYMLGTTGGYLIGFIFAAYLAGLCAERDWAKNYISAFRVALLSTAVIFVLGLLWLGAILG